MFLKKTLIYGVLAILGRWTFLFVWQFYIGYFGNWLDHYIGFEAVDENYQAFLIVFMGCLILNEIRKGNNQPPK